jgi:trehalose 6-phosphate phosphatase
LAQQQKTRYQPKELVSCRSSEIMERLERARRLWLFLDYDGTLADFAPTPEHVFPDEALIRLLTRLAEHPRIRVAVVSGRRLEHVNSLVPVPEILLAGSYGIELRTPQGERPSRVAYSSIRPILDDLKPRWAQLLSGREGFFLEDKGWALAVHARFADDAEAAEVLATARRMAEQVLGAGFFRLLGGHKFLEIGPNLAHKGKTVAFLLDEHDWPGALPLYLGDDDKDEEAFGVIKALGGMAVLVTGEPRETQADCWLPSPQAARSWLESILELYSNGE